MDLLIFCGSVDGFGHFALYKRDIYPNRGYVFLIKSVVILIIV